MSLYTPFLAQATEKVGNAYMQKQAGQLAERAYMGDQEALGALYRLDPNTATQIKNQRLQEEQAQLQRSATNLQMDATRQNMRQSKQGADQAAQQFAMQNREALQGILTNAAKFETYEEAQPYIAREIESLKAAGVQVPADMSAQTFTPEVFAQIKQLHAPKGEGFTLAKGAERYGPDGNLIASNAEVMPGFEIISPQEAARLGLPADKQFQRNTQTQQISQVGSGPAVQVNTGAATEGERTAGILANRLDFAQSQINDILAEAPDSQSPGALPTVFNAVGLDYLARVSNPAERQVIEAAQDDMLDAALTLGTGAAYTREQFQAYKRSYFPQLGDDPKTIEAKAKRLTNLLDAAYQKAGRGAPATRRSAESPVGPQGSTPTVNSQAEFDALPSGSVFIEDGQEFRKP